MVNVKLKSQGHWELKRMHILHISSLKVDQLTSRQHQNDPQPILHIPASTFHRQIMQNVWIYALKVIFLLIVQKQCHFFCLAWHTNTYTAWHTYPVAGLPKKNL